MMIKLLTWETSWDGIKHTASSGRMEFMILRKHASSSLWSLYVNDRFDSEGSRAGLVAAKRRAEALAATMSAKALTEAN